MPTGCCGCRATTRVSDNVVVAVADIFLLIFLSVVIQLAKCGDGQPGSGPPDLQSRTAILETERTDSRIIPAHRFISSIFSHPKLKKINIFPLSRRGGSRECE